jgi:hypothetical protein
MNLVILSHEGNTEVCGVPMGQPNSLGTQQAGLK